MDFAIRPASVHDADALRDVHHASFRVAYGDLIPEPELSRSVENKDTEWYRQMIDAPGTPRAGTWTAVADGAPVGFAHYRESSDPAAADLTLLYLHPDTWGQGIARPLLDAVLDDMRTLEFHAARLEAFADNFRVRAFCERAGFRQTDQYGDAAYGEVLIPVVHYRLPL